jgi:nitrite reductase (NO-forming)
VAIDVVMGDIFYQPTGVEVPAGSTLTVHARNEGNLEHDFETDDGQTTGILQAGEEATETFGPFTEDTTAYCTVPGHREAGMEFEITVTG